MDFIIRDKDNLIGYKVREGKLITYKNSKFILTTISDTIRKRKEFVIINLEKIIYYKLIPNCLKINYLKKIIKLQ